MQSFQFTPLFSPLSLSRCFSLSLSVPPSLLLRCARRFVGRDAASAEKLSGIFGFQLGLIERRFFSLIPSTHACHVVAGCDARVQLLGGREG